MERYPSCSSEANGLLKGKFIRPAKSQVKWYGLHCDQQKTGSASVSSWNSDASKLNRSSSQIARAADIASTQRASRQISQESLRRWEKSADEASIICNPVASFNRCLYKVQENMQTQLEAIWSDHSKGKYSDKVSAATDEFHYQMDFDASMAKTMEYLSDFVSMVNLTLARRDSCLSHLKTGIKPNSLVALTAPFQMATFQTTFSSRLRTL